MYDLEFRRGLYEQAKPELYNVPFRTDSFNGMPYRRLGGSGLQASVIGLGTWKFGYPETGDGARVDEKTAFGILDRAVELGVTFWDTANRYNDAAGNSERVIGKWIKSQPDQRRNIILATKIFGGMDGVTPNHSGLSRLNILEATYACLERLQTDYVDLLYFHFYDAETPIEESLGAMEDLVRQDLVRYFGVSNFTRDQLTLYQTATQNKLSRCRVVAVQNHYDIIKRESEKFGGKGVLAYAAGQGISFIAWSPLARGLLTERYLDLSKVGAGDRLYDEKSLNEDIDDQVMEKLHRLAEVAHDSNLELNQLALAYMLRLPGMGPVIPSASNVHHLESNAAAGQVKLSDEQIRQIRQIVAGQMTELQDNCAPQGGRP